MIEAFSLYSRGYSHAASNLPCQDRATAWTNGVSGVCAVADGHGSPIHFRSGAGAQYAVEIAEECLKSYLSHDPFIIIKYLPSILLHKWHKACLAHFRLNPLTAEERQIAGENDFDIAWYGTTLICGAMTPLYVVIMQIGDGEALAFRHDGRIIRPVPGDDLYGGVTRSLCDPAAAREFRCRCTAWPASAQIKALFLCTDGIANSYAPKSLEAFGKGVVEAIGNDREYAIAQLADWLPELSKRGSADDMAVAGVVAERRFLTQWHGFSIQDRKVQ